MERFNSCHSSCSKNDFSNPVFPTQTAAAQYPETFRGILRNMIHGMTDAGLTDSISHNFMVQMIPHHQAAVEMSCAFLRCSSDKSLRTIASQIITEQTADIASLQQILGCCTLILNDPKSLFHYQNRMNQTMETMFIRMTDAPFTDNIQIDFIAEMIPHHEGAIQMYQNALQYKLCPELITLLNNIIGSQQQGVHQMRRLLADLQKTPSHKNRT